jgi:hypothetical protein
MSLELNTKLTKANLGVVKFTAQGAVCEFNDKSGCTRLFIYCKEDQLRSDADWRSNIILHQGEDDIFGRYKIKSKYLDL